MPDKAFQKLPSQRATLSGNLINNIFQTRRMWFKNYFKGSIGFPENY